MGGSCVTQPVLIAGDVDAELSSDSRLNYAMNGWSVLQLYKLMQGADKQKLFWHVFKA